MNKIARLVAVAAFSIGALYAQPRATAVLNNASYALPGLSNSPIARGSLFAVFGTNLATSNQVATSFPLSTNMGGTEVTVTVAGRTHNALMVYTTPGQIGAILPSDTPEGDGTLTLRVSGQSTSIPIQVARSAFGIFTANQGGTGPGAIQLVNSETDRPVVGLTRPARPGQTMILWGTGLGPTSRDEAAGPVPGDLPVDLELYVGGRRATVTYKGRSGCCAGIDQIAFVVPEGVQGCYVPVVVKIGNVISNFATISVAPQGAAACSDPNGFTAQELLAAQSAGSWRLGVIDLSRDSMKLSIPGLGSFESKSDTGDATFSRYTFNQLLTAQGTGAAEFMVSPGSCSAVGFRPSEDLDTFVDPVQGTPLDAGPAINVVGPAGRKQLARKGRQYHGELGGDAGGMRPGMPGGASQPPFLEPGSYEINNGSGGSGADAVGAFTVRFNMQPLVSWSNEASVTSVNRASGQEITWTGGDPNGFVRIWGISSSMRAGAMFICTERASAGRFTIPSYVTLMLPATSGESLGFLAVSGESQPVRFTAPGLDAGLATTSSSTMKTVTYR